MKGELTQKAAAEYSPDLSGNVVAIARYNDLMALDARAIAVWRRKSAKEERILKTNGLTIGAD